MGWFSSNTSDRDVIRQVRADENAAARAKKFGTDPGKWQRKADAGRAELARRERDNKRAEKEAKRAAGRRKDETRKAAGRALADLNRDLTESERDGFPGLASARVAEEARRAEQTARDSGNSMSDIAWEARQAARRW